MSQSAAKLQGMLERVDAVDAVVADVQRTATVGTTGMFDVKDQAVKHRVLGPTETHGGLSGLRLCSR